MTKPRKLELTFLKIHSFFSKFPMDLSWIWTHSMKEKFLVLNLDACLCFFSTEHSYMELKFYYLCSLHFAMESVLDQRRPEALVTTLHLWRVSVNIHIRKEKTCCYHLALSQVSMQVTENWDLWCSETVLVKWNNMYSWIVGSLVELNSILKFSAVPFAYFN